MQRLTLTPGATYRDSDISYHYPHSGVWMKRRNIMKHSPLSRGSARHWGIAASLVLSAGAGCSGEDTTDVTVATGTAQPSPAPGDADPAPNDADLSDSDPGDPAPGVVSNDGPVYALMTQVYGVDDRTVYVSLSNTLDVESVSLSDAREFPGVANLAAVGGRLLISSGIEPVITEYAIGDDLSWTQGRSVSFVQYPLGDNANFYYQFILDDNTAYLPFDAFKRIIWDPTAMEIRGVMDDTALTPEQGGLLLEAGGNRNSVEYDGAVLQAFFYHDEDWFRFGGESLVALYDPVTHREREVMSLPCPGASIATVDEDGYTYFGPWSFLGTLALYGEGPAPCVARLTPDLTLDAAWTTDLTDLTEGRYINNFRYIGNGKALANVLHHELIDADFSAPYDADVAAQIGSSGPHWRLWLFDVRQGTAAPVEGIDVDIASGAQFAVLDGRTFVFLPFDDWGKTMVYELDADARATRRFEVLGDVFKWIRVR